MSDVARGGDGFPLLPSPTGRRAGDEGEQRFGKRGICCDAPRISSLRVFRGQQMLHPLTPTPLPRERGKRFFPSAKDTEAPRPDRYLRKKESVARCWTRANPHSRSFPQRRESRAANSELELTEIPAFAGMSGRLWSGVNSRLQPAAVQSPSPAPHPRPRKY